MKKYIIIFLTIILFFCCKKNIKLIPEITSSISEEIIYDLNDPVILRNIVKKSDEIVYMTPTGKIVRFNPEKRKISLLFLVNTKIEPIYYTQNDLVILKKQHADTIIVFDLNKMQIKKTLPHIKIKNIIGINENIIIHRNKNELIFFNYISRTVLKKTKTEGDEIFNCEFRDNNIFILSNSNFFIYNQPKNSIQDITLKNRATSKFLLENHNIYYGSKNREFIKLSINSNKVKWKFKIPKILKLKPRKAGKLITILPEDNNIYFFKKNGTMYWWEKLDSTRLLPPIVMKKNICVFLMPKSKPNIKFFNYEKKKVLSYKFQHQKRSNPIYINDYLYILSKEKKKPHTSVIRMGNKYGIKVNIDPEFVKPTGKSIQFDLEPINLIKPEFDIKILNEAEKNVFTKKMKKEKQATFIWIPNEASEYKLIVKIDAENKKDLIFNQNFKVVDIEQILKNYFFNIQKKCKTGFFSQIQK